MEKKEKKKVGTINAFVIVFAVIIGCWLLSFLIAPGAFERTVMNGYKPLCQCRYGKPDRYA